MLRLKTLLENAVNDNNQFFDIGSEFSSFKTSLKSLSTDLIKKYQLKINQYLKGKRIIAKSSRGYKQFAVAYEFDVSDITIENYYGNYVIIAYDRTSPKVKKYFLLTDEQIKIIGPATGQPSPQKGVNPAQLSTNNPVVNPVNNVNNNIPQTSSKPIQPVTSRLKEDEEDSRPNKQYDAYSIDSIVDDVKDWLPLILKKKDTPLVDFVKKIGWTDKREHGVLVSVFELHVPLDSVKYKIERQGLQNLFYNKSPLLNLIGLEENKKDGYWNMKIKKVYREK